jgi:hypothetical protein
VGVTDRDGGMFTLSGAGDPETFVKACGELRYWDRVA